MQLSTILVSTLAVAASAAPSYPKVSVKDARSAVESLGQLSGYFNLLAHKAQAAKIAGLPPVCDLSKAHMPDREFPKPSNNQLECTNMQIVPSDIPQPSKGLKVRHVAVGRGTQNYTCDTTNPSSAPVLAGALATLFNASCVASSYPDLLQQVPGMAVHFNLSSNNEVGPTQLPVSGVHYFTNGTTPFFDLNTASLDIGEAPCAKNNSAPAPTNSPTGQLGEGAVPWLKLTARDGATGNIKEVYRLSTAGGSAPATCDGLPATFEVQYSSV